MATEDPEITEGQAEEGEGTAELEGGSYDVIRKRLLDQASELGKRAQALNEKRQATFGGSELALIGTERIRTENNCVPRDIRPIGGKLLFGYNVFIGLKSEIVVGDVFSEHKFEQSGDSFDLTQIPFAADHYMSTPEFIKEFSDLYKYAKDARLLQLITTETRVLAVFQVGDEIDRQKVLRWRIDKGGAIKFMDTRGDEDIKAKKSHSFEWTRATREDQVSGRHPHYSIYNQVFVETSGGDLTIKIENNTEEGEGIYNELVEDKNQTIDDAELFYAQVGTLILFKIKPYREPDFRHFIFNTRLMTVLRNDTIGSACLELPEDQGVIFPGGYYLRTGEFKVFDSDTKGIEFDKLIKSPNGEDVLYVFHRMDDGHYLLLPYNLIRKEVSNQVHCHGFSIFDDGKMVVFRATSEEPTRVHPMQIWQTPFTTQEFAASAPTDGSYLAKVGNAELVRGISETLTLRSLAITDTPTRQTYEDVISTAQKLVDSYYWVSHAEAGNLSEIAVELKKTAELIVDEFEKVTAMKRRAAESLAEAVSEQVTLLAGLRPQDMKSVEDFMQSLTKLRNQRGHLISMRDLRYMDLAKVDELEAGVIEHFETVSKGCVEFLLGPTALKPLLTRLTEVVGKVESCTKASELTEINEDLDQVNEGLGVLSEVIAGLAIDDATQRTQILEGISEVYAQLNRARATLQGRKKQLSASEGKAEFQAQFQLFGQAVQSGLAVCDTPEKCDEQLSRLQVQLEELEGRFGEFDEFLGDLAEKREEVTDAFQARRQVLLDERQRRAANILGAAERIVAGVQRRALSFGTTDELNAYFASDAMVLKCRDLAKQLLEIGDSVKADEIDSKIKSAKQEATRALRDKLDLFVDGENVIKFGKHRFNVTTQKLELTIVPREDPTTGAPQLFLHLTGTDFYEAIEDDALESARDLWPQRLVSEDDTVYRAEFLAASMLFDAEEGKAGLNVEALQHATVESGGMVEVVRKYASDKHDEGYDRGVHDSDAALILEKVMSLRTTAGLLRYASDPRALACLFWANVPENEQKIIHRRAMSVGRLKDHLESVSGQLRLAEELSDGIMNVAKDHRLDPSEASVRMAARYLVDQTAEPRPRFQTSAAAITLRDSLLADMDRAGSRRDFDEDLRALAAHPAERMELMLTWVKALVARHDDLHAHEHAMLEAAVLLVTDSGGTTKIDREPTTAAIEGKVTGLLGQHKRVADRAMDIRLDEFLGRLEHFVDVQAPRFRDYRKARHEVLEKHKIRLRLSEFEPRILSSFVRNQLIDQVYLPIVGDNLAKQMGAAGDTKRTDLMGLLMLISPPGYGKTTLMEYVANRLGLIFMKINGPSLGHEVQSLDPEDAPNATAKQEVDKLNLALEMGNNVMIYVDDIQHTNPEFLQKFISLCDAQRRIEGVWKGRTRTYDLRGKKVCVVMAGNPYTETGEKFSIPDMLANRADTYNLGDILEGQDDVFALSYIENALTSNAVLAPLSGREPSDTYNLIKMAQGEEIPMTDLKHPYSAAEVSEIVEVFKRMFTVQKVLLDVNLQYIQSASQDDAYRTEPPFKLQGSYRNMNKVAEKIVSAHTEEEVEALIDDHYNGESQTLTTGAEQNLLKLAEMRGRMSDDELKRWEEIKKGFSRVKMQGGKEDDPVARVTGAMGSLAGHLSGIEKTLDNAAHEARVSAKARLAAAKKGDALAPILEKLDGAIAALSNPKLEVSIDRDPAIAELLSQQLRMVDETVLPIAWAAANSITASQEANQKLLSEQAENASDDAASDAQVAAQTEAQMAMRTALQGEMKELIDAQKAAVEEVKEVAQNAAQQAAAAASQEASQAKDLHAAQMQMRQVTQALSKQVATAQAQTQHAAQVLAHQTAQAQEVTEAAQAAAAQTQQAAAHTSAAAQQTAQAAQATHQASQQVSQASSSVQQTSAQMAQARQAAQQQAAQHQAAQQTQQRQYAQPTGQHAQAAAAGAAGAQAGQMAPQSSVTVGQMMATGAMPQSYVQRPGASAEENAAVARAQLAAQRASQAQSGQQEVQNSIHRVEHRIVELSSTIKLLQDRIAQGIGQATGAAPPRYDAPLGMSSDSNFYNGVAGGPVTRDGGIFVQTYRPLPKRGVTVQLRVSLPGGVEFETAGLVEWIREARSRQGKPGFGARFVELPAHARQVVEQFAANRAPIIWES